MKHVAAIQACLFAALMAPSPASAGDWSFSGNVNNRLDIFDNYGLKQNSAGMVYRDSMGVMGDFAYTTHDSKFDVIGQIVRNSFFGPGSKKLNDTTFPKISAKYHLDRKLTSFDLGAQYAYIFIPAIESFNDENQLIVVEDSSARHTFGANFGVQHKLDKLTSVSFSTAISDNTYTGAGIDNFSWNNSLGLSRQLTKLVSGNASVGFKMLSKSDAVNTDTFLYSGNLGLSAQLTKRLSGSVGFGANLAQTQSDNLLLPGRPRVTISNSGYKANAGLSYSFKTGSLGFNTSYGLQETTQGTLQNSLSLGFVASKTINEVSSVSLSANALYTSALGSTGNTLARYSIGPTYSLKLAKDWQFLAGYNFTLRDSGGVTTTANSGFVSLTKNFAWK